MFDQSNNTGSIDVKMDGFLLEEKSTFKKVGLIFSSKLDWGSYIIPIGKLPPRELEYVWNAYVWNTVIMSRLLYAWSTVIMSRLVPLPSQHLPAQS